MQSFSLGPYRVDVHRRAFQRSLTLRVPEPGRLKVSCAKLVPLREIIRFVNEKMDFIEACHRQLEDQRARRSLRDFVTGERCPFLGKERVLTVQTDLERVRPLVKLSGEAMAVTLGSAASSSERNIEVRDALERFYKKSGTNYLSHLVQVRSAQMGLFPKRLSFRSQRTRWGSCSSQGGISLNWRLIAGPHEIIDYVVVHELAHLRHQDHSKNFWDLVAQFCPDHRVHRKWLREHHYLYDLF